MERHGVPVINKATLRRAFDEGKLATVVYRRDGGDLLPTINSERSVGLEIDERRMMADFAAVLLKKPLPDTEFDDFSYLCTRLSDFGSRAEVRVKVPIGKPGKTVFVDLNDDGAATPEVL